MALLFIIGCLLAASGFAAVGAGRTSNGQAPALLLISGLVLAAISLACAG